jgi:hypothetical protein
VRDGDGGKTAGSAAHAHLRYWLRLAMPSKQYLMLSVLHICSTQCITETLVFEASTPPPPSSTNSSPSVLSFLPWTPVGHLTNTAHTIAVYFYSRPPLHPPSLDRTHSTHAPRAALGRRKKVGRIS